MAQETEQQCALAWQVCGQTTSSTFAKSRSSVTQNAVPCNRPELSQVIYIKLCVLWPILEPIRPNESTSTLGSGEHLSTAFD